MAVVRSIGDMMKHKGKAVASIVLAASDDLVCRNLMCEKLLGPCVCRLERALAQYVSQPSLVENIDLSNNALEFPPPTITKFPSLTVINLSKNKFSSIDRFPWEELSTLRSLRHIDLTDNEPKLVFDEAFYAKYPQLKGVLHS